MLKQRLITALILIPLVVWAVLRLPPASFAALLAVVVLMASWEWSNLLGSLSLFLRGAYVALTAGLLWWVWLWHFQTQAYWVLGLAFAGWLLWMFWIGRPELGRDGGTATRLFKAVVGLLVLVPAWLGLVLLHARPAIGPQTVLFLMVLIWVADSGAYFSGRRWGRHKLAPQVSPGKTWEGVYGALAACALVALLGAWSMDGSAREMVSFLLVCMVTILFSIEGDLLESLMKRQRGIKDSGQLLPGHGGLLDRVDSLTAAAPVFALGLHWAGL